jgi:hypothetical protein
MSILSRYIRPLWSMILGAILAISTFGLSLAIFWTLNPGGDADYKIVTSLISAYLSFLVSGFSVSFFVIIRPLLYSGLFGFVFGLFSFSYILGADLTAFLFSFSACITAILGGWLATRSPLLIGRSGRPSPQNLTIPGEPT